MTTRQSDRVEISIGGSEFTIIRSRLGTYLDLGIVEERTSEAIEKGDNAEIADCLYEYLALAIPDLKRKVFESAPWLEIIYAVTVVQQTNRIPNADRYAILNADGGRSKPPPYSYLGRNKNYYHHILARAYGWSIDEIDQLWPEDAVALIMEILVDEFHEQEFIYSLSEVAYEYDKATKKSRYQPMKKPLWMIQGIKTSKERRQKSLLTRLRVDSLPVGHIIKSDEK